MRSALLQPASQLTALGLASVLLSFIALVPRPARADEPYFPDLVFGGDRQWHDGKVKEYAPYLKAMKEPSLWRLSKANPEVTIYRLLWLKESRHPLTVRITKAADGVALEAVELDGLYGHARLAKTSAEKRHVVTSAQWKQIEVLIDAENPWFKPVGTIDDNDDEDGRVLLECVAGGKYHVVDRPIARDEMRDLQRYMLDLSRLEWQPETYFPPIKFVQDHDADDEKMFNDQINDWYSTFFFAMKEPSLWKRAKVNRKDTVIRLLWVPTHRHPISIRIVHSGDSTTLFATELDGAGDYGYDPGQVVTRQTMRLTPELWGRINAQLDQLKVTMMPSSLESEPKLGAKQIVFEFANEGQYHLVNRSSGKGEFGRFCRFLLELPGLKWSIKPFITSAAANPGDQDSDSLFDGYDDFLWAMSQPSLQKLARVDRMAIALQFLYRPCFGRPFSIRIWKDAETLKLNAVQLDGAGGFQPGSVVLNRMARLTQDQWDKLMRELDRLNFWEMPSQAPPRKEIAIDPDYLRLEQARLGKYHYVSRFSPIPEELFHLFESMIALSGMDREAILEN